MELLPGIGLRLQVNAGRLLHLNRLRDILLQNNISQFKYNQRKQYTKTEV